MAKTITFRPTDREEIILDEAAKLLGAQGRSQVIHLLLEKGYESLSLSSKPKSLEESGFIGCGASGSKQNAGNHKKLISETLGKKWS